ncbi:hypothetical protein KMT30_05885 [Streptomyces sp. IBSBF 2953]|nr:hypothetical protein [Streptomyces hayashii]
MIDENGLVLAFKRYAMQFAVAEDLVLDWDVAVQQQIFGQYVFRIQTKILADDLPPEHLTQRTRVIYEIPSSTWQMWKKRHVCRWYARHLVARWPVRYGPDPDGRGADAVCSFDLERYRAYPRARVQLPRDQFGPAYLAHGIRNVRWDQEGVDGGE